MTLDIIDISLEGMTDHVQFESLASELMRAQGYSNIIPLGGVSDSGKDAVHESIYESRGKFTTIFQYTLQKDIDTKTIDTAEKLRKNNIQYDELVLVTTRVVNSAHQRDLETEIRKKYGVNLKIYERKTLTNRLADYKTGVFNRYFPDIQKQIHDLVIAATPGTQDENGQREILRASLAFCFDKNAPKARKSIMDYIYLGLLSDSQETTAERLASKFHSVIPNENPTKPQVLASIERLNKNGLTKSQGENIAITKTGLATIAAATVNAKSATDSLIRDIVSNMRKIAGSDFSDAEKEFIAQNTGDMLMTLFQNFGIEISNKVLRKGQVVRINIDSSDDLLEIARRRIKPEIARLLLSVVAEIINKPNEEQAIILKNWALAYLGVEIMNLDPALKQLHAQKLSAKTFIVDTDFLLDCLVKECEISKTYIALVEKLLVLGCKVIVPVSCVREALTHATIAHRTYNYFNPHLLSLNSETADIQIGNVFVKGYYFAIKNGYKSNKVTFDKYMEDYLDPRSPDGLFPSCCNREFA